MLVGAVKLVGIVCLVIVGAFFLGVGTDYLRDAGFIPVSDAVAPWLLLGIFAAAPVLALWLNGWWGLLQITCFAAVLCANIYWKLTPNGVVAAMAAYGAAYSVTWLLTWLLDYRKRRKAQLGS